MTSSVERAGALRDLCPERVFLPGDGGYDTGRTVWNLAVDQRPAAVAVPQTVEEVVTIVRASAEAGLRIAPQSTGHNAGPLNARSLDDVVLMRLHELTGVSVDPSRRIARVSGGSLWRDVIAAAAPYGLTAAHGSAPDVSVAGYALGGGLSFYGRRHGLAANSVRAVEVVIADGSIVRATHTEQRELFWGIRGGGGNFGVVVALEIELLEYPSVYAGMLMWPQDAAHEAVHAWAKWTRGLPESVTTSLRMMNFPDLAHLPTSLRARRVVVVDGAILEPDDVAAELLRPLRDARPEGDAFTRIPAEAMLGVHMDPPAPVPAVSDHTVLRELPTEAVDAFLRAMASRDASSLFFGELRHLGGAMSRPRADGGVISYVPGEYMLFATANAPSNEAAAHARQAAARLCGSVRPWEAQTRVLNFDGVGSDLSTVFGDSISRLTSLRDSVDPTHTFVANHSLDR